MLQQSHQKLLIIIASDGDADVLMKKMVKRGYPATKVGSTGGFLRRSNVTILSGVEAGEVEDVLTLVRQECRSRTELVPTQVLPFPEAMLPAEPVEVRVGGAIVFVLPVERFEKT
jgi:uncharacterized protein YaaQ